MEKARSLYTAVAHSLLADKILTMIKEAFRKGNHGKNMCLVVDEEFPAKISLVREEEAKDLWLKTEPTRIEAGLILENALFFIKQLQSMKI